MPANNPLVGGMHISNWTGAGENPTLSPAPAPPKASVMAPNSYRTPVVVLMALALLFLFLFTRAAGFRVVASASAGR